jgi:NADPH:quinone reductase-like Zn-dependent oxidoreductase
MRALHVPAVGEHERLSDLPVPSVTAGTVLIRVAAAALNAVDNFVAIGMLGSRWPRSFPVILGRDAAGVVEAVGAGVEHVAVGDEVVGTVPLGPLIQAGTLAEYALLPADSVVVKPAGLDFVSAAAIPYAGAVATAAVDAVDPGPGQTVLVNGASGGVGSYAIQLAAARGAEVIATGTPCDADRLARRGPGGRLHRRTGGRAGPHRVPGRGGRALRPRRVHGQDAAAGRGGRGRCGGQRARRGRS